MSTYSLQVNDDYGNLVWDSYTVSGGVIADIVTIAANSTGTWTYPSFPGRSIYAVPVWNADGTSMNITTDTNLGYPRMIANGFPANLQILVVVL